MKKIIFALLLILGFSGILWANQVIEVGDTLSFHAVDDKQADLILGTVAQVVSYEGADPHDKVVSNSGEIYLVNIGIFKVAGKTTEKVEAMLLKKFKRYNKKVKVSVLLKTIKNNRVYVLGEVLKPGLYEIPRHDKIKNRLMNVVNLAGGFQDQADLRNIVIMRDDEVTHIANLYQLMNDNDLKQNFALQDADTILVKRSFVSVYVLGQVNKPGSFPYIQKANFMDYLSEAGGYNEKADAGNVGIVRRKGDKVEIYKIRADLFNMDNKALQANIKAGDIIYVPKHFFADWKDIGTILGLTRDSIYIYDTLTN